MFSLSLPALLLQTAQSREVHLLCLPPEELHGPVCCLLQDASQALISSLLRMQGPRDSAYSPHLSCAAATCARSQTHRGVGFIFLHSVYHLVMSLLLLVLYSNMIK